MPKKITIGNILTVKPVMVALVLIWGVFLLNLQTDVDFNDYGLKPRTLDGLLGILTMSFLHGDWSHLINNSMALYVLGSLLFLNYGKLSYKVVLWIVLFSGTWIWVFARGNTHIGVSGVIYGLFGFLFLSGFLRGAKNLIALTFFVAFAYGSLVWGVFPVKEGISWEGHLFGLIAGIVLAVYFRKVGPQKKVVPLSDDDTLNEMRFGKYYWDPVKREQENQKVNPPFLITYKFKPKDEMDK